jgi:putative addiction module component (TIGR02574 family)
MTTSQVRELALGLPLKDRATLARELIDSLESEIPDPGLEDAWVDEMEARAEALERGEAKADDWQVSLERVRQRLREGRDS